MTSIGWLDRQVAGALYVTSSSLAELLVGIEKLSDGKRKQGLSAALAELLDALFGRRILPFDQVAAMSFASIVNTARSRGQVISVEGGQIAAIAAMRGFAIATRDTEPFAAAGVPVINPWVS